MRCIKGGALTWARSSGIAVALFGMLGVMSMPATSADSDDGFVSATDRYDVGERQVRTTSRQRYRLVAQDPFIDDPMEPANIPSPPVAEGRQYQPPTTAYAPGCGCESCGCSQGCSASTGPSCGCAAGGCDSCTAAWKGYRSGGCDGGCDAGCGGGCDAGCGAGCGGGACGCAPCPCGPPGRFWARAEYLMWWTKGFKTPPLVTTSPLGTPRPDAGVLGEQGTRILFGGDDLVNDDRYGGRIRFGMWLDGCNLYGVEADFLALNDETQRFGATSRGGVPILARPFYNPLIYAEDAELVGYPNILEGRVAVEADSSLTSAGVRWRCNLLCNDNECARPCSTPIGRLCYLPGGTSRLDFLVGYRFMQLDESLFIGEDLNAFPINNQYRIFDAFDAETEFHGAELGLMYEYHRCRWSLELLAKVALGNNHQTVEINGGTNIVANGIPNYFPGGLLAQRSNMGSYEQDKFGFIPELGVTFGYRVTDALKVSLGYSFVYWTKVVRPGEQIDRVVNPNLLPPEAVPFSGPLRPAFVFHDSDYWAQGLNLGLEYRF